ncbi:MAG: response regulator transcription factor [Chloroflexi bacterium]|nr:response regulator transcription factor [Chloroflexota bacterium]
MNTVVIVDDDSTNVSLLKMLLELDGYAVLACKNIDEAQTAAAQDVDAFVIDCYLAQGASGLSLLKDVRSGQTAANKNCVVLMVSGDYRLENEALAAGADDFFLKPYSPSTLSNNLHALLLKKEHSG